MKDHCGFSTQKAIETAFFQVLHNSYKERRSNKNRIWKEQMKMANMNDCPEKLPLTDEYLEKMNAYWRAANYLAAAQLYMLDNPLYVSLLQEIR